MTRPPAKAPTPSDRPMACVAVREIGWRDPVAAAAPFAEEPYAATLLSAGDGWSYVLRAPDRVCEPAGMVTSALDALLGPPGAAPAAGGPPFQGGVVGLAAYELSARLEATAPQARDPAWPDLVLLRYPALLAFHARSRRALAIGRGGSSAEAEARAAAAASWLGEAPPPAWTGPLAEAADVAVPDAEHAAAVAGTVARIAAGEIFQANLARPWRGRLAGGAEPFELFRRLARRSPAPYAAWLRLPGRALVSNSPERFLSIRPTPEGLVAETHPIKGTRPRGRDAAEDAALAAELMASAKDRAENLMIVDLMRNDLARSSVPGGVSVPSLAALESYANVHHLVSRVRARLAPGRSAWDAFLAAFPPGSVTGAPKLQAMRVIADHEPPRGPYCGSLFWAGPDGAFESSVLIRTVALTQETAGWRFEARAGGGIVADSEPMAEVAETRAKIGAILGALLEAP